MFHGGKQKTQKIILSLLSILATENHIIITFHNFTHAVDNRRCIDSF